MAHKVDPKTFRTRGLSDWKTRAFYENPAQSLEEDFVIRKFLNKKLERFGLEKIELERSADKLNIIITSSRPGLIIGRGGEGVETLKKELDKELAKISKHPWNKEAERKEKAGGKKEIKIEIQEIKNPWVSASLTAQWAASQLEKRVAYRRVLKQGLSKMMANKEIKGARIELAGRLNGSEIARREWVASGSLPLQTLRANVDYAKHVAKCSYGVIGIKVWMYKGEEF